MTTTTKAAHTPGPVTITADAIPAVLHIRGRCGALHIAQVGSARTDADAMPEVNANAKLIAEAFDVSTETGMTPRQLANELFRMKSHVALATTVEAHRDELLALLQEVRKQQFGIGIYGIPEPLIIEIDAAISKATGGT